MPPKRPTPTDNLSPPPTHRTVNDNEHHHSPLPGHHPDLPVDAAVANTSPQSKRSKENDMSSLPSIMSTPEINPDDAIAQNAVTTQPELAIVDLTSQPSPSTSATAILMPNATTNGGARAAFIAAQQQRTITCNLSLLPLSKCTRASP